MSVNEQGTQAQGGAAATPKKTAPSGLMYLNFFLAVVALVGVVSIAMDPGSLVPGEVIQQTGQSKQRLAQHTLALQSVDVRLAKLEQATDARELLLDALTTEVIRKLEFLAAQQVNEQRKAAYSAALKALVEAK